MGRPLGLESVCEKYLSALEGHRAELTLRQLRRDLKTIQDDIHTLHASGCLTTSDPRALSAENLAAIIAYWRVRPKRGPNARGKNLRLDPTSQVHLWRALKGLLDYCGNGAIGQLKTLPYVELPRTLEKPVDTFSPEDLQRLRMAADSIRGWRGIVARFLIDFCPGTALRPKEVRMQEASCIDLSRGSGLVCHPKGEGKYAVGHRESFLVDALALQALCDFLPERERYLGGEKHPALVPFRNLSGNLAYWPESSLRKLMGDLGRASGVKVSLNEFRATFGQRAIDNGARIESVSRCMRHKSTLTTEKYYARVKPQDAMDEVRIALAGPGIKSG